MVWVMNENQEGNVGANAPWWILFLFTQYPCTHSFKILNFLFSKELISCNLGRYFDQD